MATAQQQQDGIDEIAVIDWRFVVLTRAGYAPDDAWTLASNKEVDIHFAERLLARGCPPRTALRILN